MLLCFSFGRFGQQRRFSKQVASLRAKVDAVRGFLVARRRRWEFGGPCEVARVSFELSCFKTCVDGEKLFWNNDLKELKNSHVN